MSREHTNDAPVGDENAMRRRIRADLGPAPFKVRPWRYGWFVVHQAIIWSSIACIVVVGPPAPVCAVLGLLVGTTLAAQAFLAHETLHGALGGPKWLRTFVGWLGFGPEIIPPGFWVRWHNVVHHGNTNNGDSDPDNFGTVRRYERNPGLARFVKLAPGSGTWYSYLFLFYSFTFHAQLVLHMQAKHRRDFAGMNRRLHIWQSAACVVPWVAIAAVSGRAAVYTVLIPFFTVNAIGQSYILTNHFLRPMAPTNNPIDNSMSVRSWKLVDPLLFRFSHHVEHHLFPKMPSPGAPAVRQWIEEHEAARYVCPTHGDAVRMLYRTPRVYRDATTLSNPDGSDAIDIAGIEAALRHEADRLPV